MREFYRRENADRLGRLTLIELCELAGFPQSWIEDASGLAGPTNDPE